MREIVLDTETTGLSPRDGHRVVEIGCLELENHVATDRSYHCYINPERSVPQEAVAVHGLTDQFLNDQPLFEDIVSDFLEFIGDAPLIIHNAEFDMGFLNAELSRLSQPALVPERAIDTLMLARRKFPGSPNSLDALCRRFQIDTSSREKHGALIDSVLLAEVYLELIGGRQPGLDLLAGPQDDTDSGSTQLARAPLRPMPLPDRLTDAERAAHEKFLREKLSDNAIWLR